MESITETGPRPDPAERVLPHNDEAEMALLGAILHNNRAFERVIDFLRPEHFASRVHGRIFEAITKLIDRGKVADPITLKQYFEADSDLSEIGGYAYLMRLAGSVASIVNAEDYGRAVHDLHLRRQLIAVGEHIVSQAYKDDLDVSGADQLSGAGDLIDSLSEGGGDEARSWTLGAAAGEAVEAAQRAYRRDGQLVGVPTGFADLDRLMGGLHKEDFIILAGRPSMGKTALGTNIAFHAARAVEDDSVEPPKMHGVAFFSLEMSAAQLATRILAEQTAIPLERIRRGNLSLSDFEALERARTDLADARLFIEDAPNQTLGSIRRRARTLVRKHGVTMIVIDYLQLMHLSDNPFERNENRAQELSKITRGLKGLAKQLKVPVVALSQVSRQVEDRDDKRPQLIDLRESGAIEQDADVVMFVYRDEYYLARKEPREGTPEHVAWLETMEKVHNLAEVILAKDRNGPIGKVTLLFEGAYTRFSNYVADDHLPQQGAMDYGSQG